MDWLVINLKPLNRCLHNPHFKMETLRAITKAVSPGDWSVSTDLTNVYFHVPFILEHQHFLLHAVSLTEAYQFQALPFCLCSALWTFTMFLAICSAL